MTDARTELLAKRADLVARADVLTGAPVDTGGISFGKRVGDGTAMAVERLTNVAAHEQILIQLAEVDRALAKLDDGELDVRVVGTVWTRDTGDDPVAVAAALTDWNARLRSTRRCWRRASRAIATILRTVWDAICVTRTRRR